MNRFGQSALDWRVLKSCNLSEGCKQAAMTNFNDGKQNKKEKYSELFWCTSIMYVSLQYMNYMTEFTEFYV